MTGKGLSTLRCFVLLTLLGYTVIAQAQTNELANPGFASDFTGWNQLGGRVGSWSSLDANDDPESGSALLSNEGTTNAGTPAVLFQCIPVEGIEQVLYGGDVVVPEGELPGVGAAILVFTYETADCSGNSVEFGSVLSDTVGDWNRVSGSIEGGPAIRSVLLSLGVNRPFGTTGDAVARFDNIYLYLVDSDAFAVNPSMSASWFNPDESGHGIMIHLTDADSAWMCWFTFTSTGEPAWICAIGVVIGDTITFSDAFTVEGGAFPPEFDPGLIEEVPWGSITVSFSGCDSGFMEWTTSAPGFSSGSMPLTRLTNLWGVSCP